MTQPHSRRATATSRGPAAALASALIRYAHGAHPRRSARILAGCQSVLAIRTFWPMPGCSAPVLTVREPCVLSALYIADLHI